MVGIRELRFLEQGRVEKDGLTERAIEVGSICDHRKGLRAILVFGPGVRGEARLGELQEEAALQ